jgi:hypothetical protein
MIKRMGHDLPRRLWPQILDAITDHVARATPDPGARTAA